MRKKAPPFTGVCTALATPFKSGEIDYDALKELIEYQISEGVDALLVCGTTGEASALTAKERKELVFKVAVQISGRVPLVVGVGTNVTATTVAWSLHAASCGADALLTVTPYYNKGTEEGIVSHFLEVADRVARPQIIYHVPSRTGVRLSMAQLEKIFAHPNVVAIKEADPDMDRFTDEIAKFGGEISFYTGNDSLVIPSMAMGGIGVISVISNLLPAEMSEIVRLHRSGSVKESRARFMRLLPLMRVLFERTNPAPLKYALSLCGFGTGELRLPLAPVPPELKEKIAKTMALL